MATTTKLAEKPKDLFLLEGISVITFNKDFTQVALSKKDHLIYIYKIENFQNPSSWKLLHTLNMHILYVSCLDWNPVTNKILSCSHDKTSYVWTYTDNEWTFENVVATTNLGYLSCYWNKRGDKFSECTGNKVLIGYFSTESNWWMGIQLKEKKKDKGGEKEKKAPGGGGGSVTALCAKIDPTSLYCITGWTNNKVRICSCYIAATDEPYKQNDVEDFGTIIYEFKMGSWVIDVNWSDDGIAFACGQDATIAVIDFKNQKHDLIRCTHSPTTKIFPLNGSEFYSVAFDRNIRLYGKEGENWKVKNVVTSKKEAPKSSAPSSGVNAFTGRTGGVADALKIFNTGGLKKKESVKVNSNENENINPAVITGFAIKGDEIVSVDMAGFVKFWKK